MIDTGSFLLHNRYLLTDTWIQRQFLNTKLLPCNYINVHRLIVPSDLQIDGGTHAYEALICSEDYQVHGAEVWGQIVRRQWSPATWYEGIGGDEKNRQQSEGTCQPCPLGSSSSILDLHVSLPIRKRDGLNSSACTWESNEPPTPIQTESLLRDDGSEVLVQSTRN